MGRAVKIALVAVRAANASKSWRGVFASLERVLREAGVDVVPIEIGDGMLGQFFRVKEYVVRRIIGRRYQRHREPLMLRAYGRAMDRALARHGVDIAISLKAMPMSRSRTPIPVILYNDSPFSGLLNFYREFTGMSPRHVAYGHAMELGTVRKATHSIYTSRWAADLAIRDYGVAPERVTVVPIGANIVAEPSASEVRAFIAQRRQDRVTRFLWLGVDWERKRGATAVAIIAELCRRGHAVHLTVAGAAPTKAMPAPPEITYIPFLDEAGIATQLERTHFLLLPTLADCTPLVYSEANAFGVPVISSDVGGIATSIIDGRNGFLLDVHAEIAAWADRIESVIADPEAYHALALSSHEEYITRLNWRVAVQRILEIAERISTERAAGWNHSV